MLVVDIYASGKSPFLLPSPPAVFEFKADTLEAPPFAFSQLYVHNSEVRTYSIQIFKISRSNPDRAVKLYPYQNGEITPGTFKGLDLLSLEPGKTYNFNMEVVNPDEL